MSLDHYNQFMILSIQREWKISKVLKILSILESLFHDLSYQVDMLSISLIMIRQVFALPTRCVPKLARQASEEAEPHTAHQTDINQKNVSRACPMFRKYTRKTMENTAKSSEGRVGRGTSGLAVCLVPSGTLWGAIEQIYWFAFTSADVEQLKWN